MVATLMKKILAILVLGLLWCNVGFADEYLINTIKRTHKNIFTENPTGIIFLTKELANASNILKEIGLPCYRTMIKKGKSEYNKNLNCLKFRTLFGDDPDEYITNLTKFRDILAFSIKRAEEGFFLKMAKKDMNELNESIRNISNNMNTAFQVLDFAKNN
jgi:hypothetical protein